MDEKGEETVADLGDYLSDLGTVESSGEFTISTQEALKKLGQSQLSDPHFWLAKLFQSAHRLKARSFRIEEEKRSLVIQMPCPSHWTIEKVSEALLSAQLGIDPALNHLVTGLRTAVLGLGATLDFCCHTGRSRERGFTFNEQGLRPRKVRLDVSPGTLKMTFRGLHGRERSSAKDTLFARLFSSVTVFLNGKKLESEHSRFVPSTDSRATLKFREGQIPGCGNSRYTFYDREERKPRYDDVCLLNWIQDGLIIEKEVCGQDGPFVLQAFLSGEGLETDLSGLQLRSTSLKKERKQEVFSFLARRLEDIKYGLELLWLVHRSVLGGGNPSLSIVLGAAPQALEWIRTKSR